MNGVGGMWGANDCDVDGTRGPPVACALRCPLLLSSWPRHQHPLLPWSSIAMAANEGHTLPSLYQCGSGGYSRNRCRQTAAIRSLQLVLCCKNMVMVVEMAPFSPHALNKFAPRTSVIPTDDAHALLPSPSAAGLGEAGGASTSLLPALPRCKFNPDADPWPAQLAQRRPLPQAPQPPAFPALAHLLACRPLLPCLLPGVLLVTATQQRYVD